LKLVVEELDFVCIIYWYTKLTLSLYAVGNLVVGLKACIIDRVVLT